MLEAANNSRRRFLRSAGVTLGAIGAAIAPSRGKLRMIAMGTSTSFGAIRRIDAGLLSVGYAVLLLHAWPYDIHCYVEVAPMLAAAGYRSQARPHTEAHE